MTLASAASHAIQIARKRGLSEVGPDELLLGCLMALSRFGVVQLGRWCFDMDALGIDWLEISVRNGGEKVSYSEAGVAVFDKAATVARADGCSDVRIEHLLVAFSNEGTGLMGHLKQSFGIDSVTWRVAVAGLSRSDAQPAGKADKRSDSSAISVDRAWLTPEEAAETLGIHVQTLRAYVRSGKLPASRLAGERSLRILRTDLEKVLEPLILDE